MPAETRSQQCCWTCRLRKRKCDEKLPICSECQGLGLECHEYQTKPTWMDRGAKQKAYAIKIKQTVAAARRHKRRHTITKLSESCDPCVHDPVSASIDVPALIATPETGSDDFLLSSHIEKELSCTHALDSRQLTSNTIDTAISLHMGVDTTSNQYRKATEGYITTSTHLFLPTNSSNDSDVAGPMDEILASSPFQEMPDSLGFDFEFAEFDHMISNSSAQYISEDGLITPIDVQFPPNYPDLTGTTYPASPAFRQGHTHQTSAELPQGYFDKVRDRCFPTINDIDDALSLAYYFEKVYAWQFQFGQAQRVEFNQGHVMWMISKSRPLHQATLALSSAHRKTWKTRRDTSSPFNSYEHIPEYQPAIDMLEDANKDISPRNKVWRLAHIVMLLYLTLLYRSTSTSWQIHLQAGIAIVKSWEDRKRQTSQICKDIEGNESDVIESARMFLISSIIRFDILSSLTNEAAPRLSSEYKRLLRTQDHGISMESAFGCRNWVLIIIIDLYSLRDWKKSFKSSGMLSLRELMRKTQSIKDDLERAITDNFEDMRRYKSQSQSNDNGDISSSLNHQVCVVTHIFACAVSVLLEVIVSGALPKLPDIRKYVTRALESFAYVDDPELLHVLRWPLCVVGIVAEEDQRDFFRTLLTAPNVARYGAFQQSLQLLEKGWRLEQGVQDAGDGFELFQLQKLMSWNHLIV